MPRVTRGPASRNRRRTVLKATSGFCHGKNVRIRLAKEALMRAMRNARRDRRQRKRQMRMLWIQRLHAACDINEISYNQFIHGLKLGNVALDRKILSKIACEDAETFAAIAKKAKESGGRVQGQHRKAA